jgi:hypothetical protein
LNKSRPLSIFSKDTTKMSLRLSAFLYGGRSEIPRRVRNRLRNLVKYNEIATPRPLQVLMVEVRNDKSGFGQHALNIQHFLMFLPYRLT